MSKFKQQNVLLASGERPLFRGHVLPLPLGLVLRIVRVLPLLVQAVALTIRLKEE